MKVNLHNKVNKADFRHLNNAAWAVSQKRIQTWSHMR